MSELEQHKTGISNIIRYIGAIAIIIAFIGSVSVALYNISDNTKTISNNNIEINKELDLIKKEFTKEVEVVEGRLSKKISIINENKDDILEIKLDIKNKELEYWHNHYKQQIELEKLNKDAEHQDFINKHLWSKHEEK